MEETKKVIETNNLSKKFDDKWAVSNINLEVAAGQIFGVLGPNGAGKSTLIRLLTSLLKPTKGSFKLFGNKPHLLNQKIYSKVGALIEEPRFYSYLTGRENLSHLGYLSGNEDKDRIKNTLNLVNLKEASNIKVSEYSHGMRRRLGLAQAFIHQPDLLILDEPMSGLDPEGAERIERILQDLNQEEGVTLLFSSHNLDRIQSLSDHMAIIHYGKLLEKGSVEDLLGRTDLPTTEVVVDRPQEAINILLTKKWAQNVSIKRNNKIKLHISKENRPVLVQLLVKRGFKIYSLTTRSALKSHYFSIINQQQKQVQ